jgi:hypothetical protein
LPAVLTTAWAMVIPTVIVGNIPSHVEENPIKWMGAEQLVQYFEDSLLLVPGIDTNMYVAIVIDDITEGA